MSNRKKVLYNQKHYDVVKKGPKAILEFKKHHPNTIFKLEGVRLRKANLKGADLRGALLEEADLREANLEGAQLYKANLEKADLYKAHLGGAHLEEANLRKANLEGAQLYKANLEMADLYEAQLENALLACANLKGAELSHAHLEGATFQSACLEKAKLLWTHLEKAELRMAHLEGADLSFAHLEGADISYAHLERAKLIRTHLEEANITNTYLEGADISFAYLDGASMRLISLDEQSSFLYTTFGNATLSIPKGVDKKNAIKILSQGVVNNIQFTNPVFGRQVRDEAWLNHWKKGVEKEPKLKKVLAWLWKCTSDYGRSFFRWGITSFILVLIFALIYLTYFNSPTHMHMLPELNRTNFITYLYFSFVTFATLGYGDISAVSWQAQLVAILEVVLGYIMLGGLVSILANKLSRRND